MSSFYKPTKHPETGKWENAEWLDNYFAQHGYGVRFPDGSVWNPDETKLETQDPSQPDSLSKDTGFRDKLAKRLASMQYEGPPEPDQRDYNWADGIIQLFLALPEMQDEETPFTTEAYESAKNNEKSARNQLRASIRQALRGGEE